MSEVERRVVAIDGQAGSGKSTLARRLAAHLGLPYLNTGLMYRAIALAALREGVDSDDAPGLVALGRSVRFDLDLRDEPPELEIDGKPPVEALTSPEVESTVSRVARHPEVRALLREEQRRLAQGGAVMEGRDIGTVVAPRARLKLYLQAHPEERVERRAQERSIGPAEVAEALVTRDTLDSRTNPAVPAPDAILIDTSELGPDEVFERALELARERGMDP
jgi:cytidylate kinase